MTARIQAQSATKTMHAGIGLLAGLIPAAGHQPVSMHDRQFRRYPALRLVSTKPVCGGARVGKLGRACMPC